VQHGLLTPYAPPLPPTARLLAFTEADASFAASGRDDVVAAEVGSQLLWEAGARTSPRSDFSDSRPVYLGQLHGAELPRTAKAHAASTFCRAHGATYRPHPAEADFASRIQHDLWELRGITIDRSGQTLSELGRPVVSVFSTGILEAAAHGVPAWVSYPSPPRWLAEFWDRYSMGRWGRVPTAAPPRPQREPAAAIADEVAKVLGIPEDQRTLTDFRGRE
jgi:hypothetical protein